MHIPNSKRLPTVNLVPKIIAKFNAKDFMHADSPGPQPSCKPICSIILQLINATLIITMHTHHTMCNKSQEEERSIGVYKLKHKDLHNH